MKKAIVITLSVVLLSGLIISGLILYKYFSYHNYSEPEKTVKSFVYAFNKRDVDDMVTCVDPGEAEYLRNGVAVVEDILGSDLFSSLKDYLPFVSYFDDSSDLPELKVDILDVKKEGTSARVKTKLTNKKDNETYDYDFKLVCNDEKWYIQLLSL